MRRRQILFCTLLSLLLLGTFAFAAQAQEKYRLLAKNAVGDVAQAYDEFTMDLTLKVSAGGQDIPPMQISNQEQKKYREETLAVDAKGKVQAIRRTYSIYRTVDKGAEGEKAKTSSLQGKTVTIQKKGDKVSVKSESGAIADEDRKGLLDVLDDNGDPFFPDRPVAVGEEWTPDAKTLAKKFKGAKKAEMQGKLVEIAPFGGHKCAHIHLILDVQMEIEGGILMEMKLEGEGYLAMDIQRPLTLTMDGPITVSGKGTANGADLEYSGDGKAHMKLGGEWLKVAGKPVPKSNP